MKKLALLAAVAFTAFNAHADSITGLYNTGIGATTDSHYTVDGQASYITTNGSFPLDYWFENNSTSKWLAISPSQGTTYDPSADGTYTWTLNFNIGSQYNASTAAFSGHFAADNKATAYLNGHEIGTTGGFSAADFRSFSATTGFNTGNNVFSVVVTNLAQNGGNPTGLRVEFDQSHVAAVPEAETYAMMLAGLGMLGVVARRRKAK
jgi:hypothetical protein